MSGKKALGKGLAALISQPGSVAENGMSTNVTEIDIRKIEPNRQQPRKHFEEESLRELAESIKQYGIIQPLIVKEEDGGFFSIIAGERRYRAARIARLETVPVVVKDYNESETLQVALIENIQRQDLNPIEEALCFKRLIDEYFFTQENIAEKISKSRSMVSNALSLLNLGPRVQNLLAEERIPASHARVLLRVKDADVQFLLAEKVIEDNLSIRELEKLIVQYANEAEVPEKVAGKNKPDAVYRHIEDDLKQILGTKVNIKDGKNKGRIEIEYYSPEELDRLLGMFKTMV
jgi:ParB family chromosome partitioning protein